MKINSTNNIAFGGLFSAIKSYRATKNAIKLAQKEKEEISNLTQRAEAKLQERLVSYKELMTDFYTDDILYMQTGEKFSGKFVVPADKFEHIYHVKNGEDVGSMVRLKTGQKKWANRGEYDKSFKTNLSVEEEKAETKKC